MKSCKLLQKQKSRVYIKQRNQNPLANPTREIILVRYCSEAQSGEIGRYFFHGRAFSPIVTYCQASVLS